MDFVVVGLGLSALSVLTGVLLLGWRLPLAERRLSAASGPQAAAADAAAAAIRGAGHVMLASGGAIVLATVGALAASLDDRTGAFLVVTTVTVAALGILVWGYRNRNAIPWLAPRRRPLPAGAAPGAMARLMPLPAALPLPANGAAQHHGDDETDNGDAEFDSSQSASASEAIDDMQELTLLDPDSDAAEDAREEAMIGSRPPRADPDD